jgi:hypothetical protein
VDVLARETMLATRSPISCANAFNFHFETLIKDEYTVVFECTHILNFL